MIEMEKCPLEGLLVIKNKVFTDERGFFLETYNKREMKNAGIDRDFVQDNQSFSFKGVLRGLHYQENFPQAKLVSVTNGKVFDVAVDLRKDSKTFLSWFGIELSSDNFKQLYIPEGFAHGFLVSSEKAIFSYKCTDFYHPNDEKGIIWNDKDIGILWPGVTFDSKKGFLFEDTKLIVSPKDRSWPGISEVKRVN